MYWQHDHVSPYGYNIFLFLFLFLTIFNEGAYLILKSIFHKALDLFLVRL